MNEFYSAIMKRIKIYILFCYYGKQNDFEYDNVAIIRLFASNLHNFATVPYSIRYLIFLDVGVASQNHNIKYELLHGALLSLTCSSCAAAGSSDLVSCGPE